METKNLKDMVALMAVGAMEKITGNPYEKIGNIVDAWAKENGYSDMIVTVAVNGEIKTEYMTPHFNCYGFIDSFRWEWEYDWWEGQDDVFLLGFRPLTMIRCYGCPKEIVEVRR